MSTISSVSPSDTVNHPLAATATSSPTTSTTAPPPVQPPCSSAVLFPLVVQAEPSMTSTDVPIDGTPISVDCAGGWAILENFTVQAGSGNGIALFKQVGAGWQFITMIDDSGGGPGWDPCSQYPPAALQALGRKVCAPPSGTTTTTTVALTPEQQFASDATAQIQTVSSAVASGTLTTSGLGSYGDSICNLMPQYLNTYGPGPSAFNQIANEFSERIHQLSHHWSR